SILVSVLIRRIRKIRGLFSSSPSGSVHERICPPAAARVAAALPAHPADLRLRRALYHLAHVPGHLPELFLAAAEHRALSYAHLYRRAELRRSLRRRSLSPGDGQYAALRAGHGAGERRA